jgi:hypothetical protein
MASPYQEFVQKARERFEAKRQAKASKSAGPYRFTLHSQFKMRQYGLSEQKVRSVIRNPQRREEGIMKDTVAVMQPVSVKHVNGKDVWKQEIWVMYMTMNQQSSDRVQSSQARIISAWRYPGVSPERNPVPEEILREIEEGCIFEE